MDSIMRQAHLLFMLSFAALGLGCHATTPTMSNGWLRPSASDVATSLNDSPDDSKSDPLRQRIGLIQAKAALHESDNNTAEAVRLYESILQADPKHVVALHRLAILHTQLGHAEDAEACFLRAIELADANPQLHNDFGYYCHLQGKSEAAIHHLCRAITLDSRSREAHVNLGLVYGTLGRFDEAEEEFRLAGCSRAEGLNNLAFARLMESDIEGATTTYELALQNNPGQANARRALASLQQTSQNEVDVAPVTFEMRDTTLGPPPRAQNADYYEKQGVIQADPYR